MALQEDKDQLENQISSLQSPMLHLINLYWVVEEPAKSYPDPSSEGRIKVNGTIFNSGTNTAFNVTVRFSIYIDANIVMGNVSNTNLEIALILGKAYLNFEHQIYYGSPAEIFDVKGSILT